MQKFWAIGQKREIGAEKIQEGRERTMQRMNGKNTCEGKEGDEEMREGLERETETKVWGRKERKRRIGAEEIRIGKGKRNVKNG